jgi:hypothetical protein
MVPELVVVVGVGVDVLVVVLGEAVVVLVVVVEVVDPTGCCCVICAGLPQLDDDVTPPIAFESRRSSNAPTAFAEKQLPLRLTPVIAP